MTPVHYPWASIGNHTFPITLLLFRLHHNHHHISFMELGHLLTCSGLTYPEVSSKVYHDSFCQLSSISVPWVIYFKAFYSHVVLLLFFQGKNYFIKEMGTCHIKSNLLKSVSGTQNIRMISKNILKVPECKSNRKFSGCPQSHPQNLDSTNYMIFVYRVSALCNTYC